MILSSIKNRGIQGQELHTTHLLQEELDCQGKRERLGVNFIKDQAFKLVHSATFSIDPTNMSACN